MNPTDHLSGALEANDHTDSQSNQGQQDDSPAMEPTDTEITQVNKAEHEANRSSINGPEMMENSLEAGSFDRVSSMKGSKQDFAHIALEPGLDEEEVKEVDPVGAAQVAGVPDVDDIAQRDPGDKDIGDLTVIGDRDDRPTTTGNSEPNSESEAASPAHYDQQPLVSSLSEQMVVNATAGSTAPNKKKSKAKRKDSVKREGSQRGAKRRNAPSANKVAIVRPESMMGSKRESAYDLPAI